jgi:hypothetical protein
MPSLAGPSARTREAVVRGQSTLSQLEHRGLPHCVVATNRGMLNDDRGPKPYQLTSDVHLAINASLLQYGGKTFNRQLIDVSFPKHLLSVLMPHF